MKRPNKQHRKLITPILKGANSGRIKKLIMNIPEISSYTISSGWGTSVELELTDGHTFYAKESFEAKALKQAFKLVLRHWRKNRRKGGHD